MDARPHTEFQKNDIARRYAKNEGTMRCWLGVIIDVYALQKNKDNLLLPSERLIRKIVSMWNIGKGPIDDVSHVSACRPSFGPYQRNELDLDRRHG
jgi:hypothetical protein